MAQKREKEETDLKVPENLLRTARIPSLIKPSTADDSISRSSESVDPGHPAVNRQICKVSEAEISRLYSGESSSSSEGAVSPVMFSAQPFPSKRRVINRCSGCRRKVGITGFRCRCGDMFCWEHRYSDRHDCSFDYKAAGREMIARENPVVRASKILKV